MAPVGAAESVIVVKYEVMERRTGWSSASGRVIRKMKPIDVVQCRVLSLELSGCSALAHWQKLGLKSIVAGRPEED